MNNKQQEVISISKAREVFGEDRLNAFLFCADLSLQDSTSHVGFNLCEKEAFTFYESDQNGHFKKSQKIINNNGLIQVNDLVSLH